MCQAKSLTIPWDDALDSEANHDAAATALARKLGWLDGHSLVGGGMPDGRGNCYVLIAVSAGAEASRNLDKCKTGQCRHIRCGASPKQR